MSKFKLSFVLFFSGILASLLVNPVFGQVVQPNRIEFELNEQEYEDFVIISAREEGLFVIKNNPNDRIKKIDLWEIIYLDTALNKIWDYKHEVLDEYTLMGYGYDKGFLYLLYNDETKVKEYRVDRIDISNQSIQVFKLEFDFLIYLTEFEVLDETLIFGGYVNNRPTFLCYKYGVDKQIVLPGFYNNENRILQLELDYENKSFNVLTSYKMQDKKRSISLKSFNTEGKIIKNFDLKPQGDYGLIHGHSVTVNQDFHLIVGTYAYKSSDMSRGIFVSRVSNEGDHVINYYNFGDLKNFFNYMKAKRELRVKSRIERRKVKGKKIKFSYKILVHNIVEEDDQFIMVGEAFYPKYYAGVNTYNSYYTPYTYDNAGSLIDGYVYTHAVVIGVNKEGKIIWDNSFEIEDVLSKNLDQYVQVTTVENETVLLYLYEDLIRSKIIQGSVVLDGKSYDNLKLSFEDDVVSENENEYGGLERWYDDNFYGYGYHEIKNYKDDGVKMEREVFFINKISYQ